MNTLTKNILTNLTDEAKRSLANCEDDLRIDNIILGKTLYTMKDCSTVFTDMNFCLILFENAYGFSYFQEEIDYSLSNFVNKNALTALEKDIPIYMRVSITDALYCLINKRIISKNLAFTGNIRQKAKQRAKTLLSHVPKGAKVLLLGAAAEIIEEATIKNCNLTVLDLEEKKIGLELYSSQIKDGIKYDLQEQIQKTDFVVATGMIFVTETADKIFELTKRHGKKLTLYMETGSNFGPQLLQFGADTVLSEFFPYYDFHGDTKYLLSRAE